MSNGPLTVLPVFARGGRSLPNFLSKVIIRCLTSLSYLAFSSLLISVGFFHPFPDFIPVWIVKSFAIQSELLFDLRFQLRRSWVLSK